MNAVNWIIGLSFFGAIFEFAGILLVGRRFVDLKERLASIVQRLRGVERRTSVGRTITTRWRVEAAPHAWSTERFDDVREDLDELRRQLAEVREHFSMKTANIEAGVSSVKTDLQETAKDVRRVREELTALVEREAKAPVLGIWFLLVGLGASVAATIVGALG